MKPLKTYKITDLNKILAYPRRKKIDQTVPIDNQSTVLSEFTELKSLEAQSRYGTMFFYLIDTVTMTMPYLSKSAETLTGYSWDEWKRRGPEFSIEMTCQPDDRDVMRQVIALKHQWFGKLPMHLKTACEFTFNFRLLCSNGIIKKVLHKGYFLKTDKDGKPLLVMGAVYDITPYKDDTNMILTMRGFDPLTQKALFREQSFQPPDKLMHLTGRQLEVLSHVQAGRTMTQIAAEMNISLETVKGHRKKMLAATNSRSMSELIFKYRKTSTK